MIMRKRAVFGMAIGLTLAGVSLQAGTLIIGTPADTANCDPFGCPAFFGLGTYQQVYSNAAFPGAITIDDLILYQSEVLHNGGMPSNGTYTLSFSYTTAAPGNLDLNDGPDANIAAGTEEQFFTGTLPALTPIDAICRAAGGYRPEAARSFDCGAGGVRGAACQRGDAGGAARPRNSRSASAMKEDGLQANATRTAKLGLRLPQ